MRTAILIAGALAFVAGSATAAIYFVSSDGAGDYANIQAAIDAVPANSIIELADGYYFGPGNRDLDFHGKALTIRSRSGRPADVVVWCEGAGRGFHFHTGETNASSVRGITIHGGYAADYGGGIHCSGAAPSILNCVITACTAGLRGGGIYVTGAQPVINSCVISDNTAQDGGGIAWWNANGTLWNDLMTGNSADRGDAIYASSADLYVHGCTFDQNYGLGYDAALYGTSGGGFTFTSCIVWNNDGNPMINNGLATYSCFYAPFPGTGNISSNPQFASGPGGDWYLATTSPCVNAGGNYLATSFTTADGAATRATLTTRVDETNDTGNVDMGYHRTHVYALSVPGDYATVQAALDNAWSGEQIDVASGTWHERLQFRGRAVVVQGVPNAVIDADYGGRAVTFNASEGRGAELRYLTIREGSADDGAGVMVDGASPTINGCTLTGNQASRNGGGLAVFFGRPRLHGCYVQANVATWNGAGIYAAGAGTHPVIESSMVKYNTAAIDGGGIYSIWSTVDAEAVLVSDNSAVRGGGVYLYGSTLNGMQMTIAGNRGTGGAGGVMCDDMGHALLDNTIIAVSLQGAAVACAGSGSAALACCDVWTNAGGDWTGCIAGQSGVGGNISANPLFCEPAAGTYAVHTNSPCAAEYNACGRIGWCDPTCGPYIITVLPGGGGTHPTIQAAIDACSDGGIVQLQTGTFTGVGNWDLDFKGKAIVVESASGNPDDAIIQCLDALSGPHRGFNFHSGEDSTSVLRNVTIQGGRTSSSGAGAGIVCSGGSAPKIAGCVIKQGAAYDGGAIHCHQASPILEDCLFVNCTASDAGGAMTVNSCSPEVRRCVFSNNWANWGGGAVSSYMASPKLWGCRFEFNTTNHWGAAILASGATDRPDVRGCTFRNNAADEGGALYGRNGSITTLNSCTMYDNTASSVGGTVRLYNTGAAVFEKSILWAAAYWPMALVSLQSSAQISFTCCDLRDGEPGIVRDGGSTVTWGANNLAADPRFCDIEVGDFSLYTSSPCAAENNPACGLIGAWGGVCGLSGVDDLPAAAPPAVAVLHPSRPNPFNPQTTILFELPEAGRTNLAVFDLNGCLVATLVEGELPAGAHEAIWNGRDRDGRPAASGVYICRLTTPRDELGRPMVLLK